MKKAIVLSAMVIATTLVASHSAEANPVCYMLEEDGNMVNLNHMCAGVIATPPVAQPVNASTLPVSSSAEPFTIYTSEFIADYMNDCQTSMFQELSTLESEGIYISESVANPYCQCTVNGIQNNYTSQEALAILAANPDRESLSITLSDIIDSCFERVILPFLT